MSPCKHTPERLFNYAYHKNKKLQKVYHEFVSRVWSHSGGRHVHFSFKRSAWSNIRKSQKQNTGI